MPEIPLAEELTAAYPPKLPLNDFEARPQLRDQYLETQYLLHRYEATEPLRRAVSKLRAHAGEEDINLDKVKLHRRVCPLELLLDVPLRLTPTDSRVGLYPSPRRSRPTIGLRTRRKE